MRRLSQTIRWCAAVALVSVGCGGDASPRVGGGLGDGAIVPCATGDDDWWRIRVNGPTTLEIDIDTVSPRTTFDPEFNVFEVIQWDSRPSQIVRGSNIASADDEFECTFPPPNFACPFDTVTVTDDVLLVVRAAGGGSCVGNVGEYSVNVIGGTVVEYLGTAP